MSHEHDDTSPPGPSLPPGDAGYGAAGVSPPRRGLAWERRAEIGPGPAVLRTVREVVFAPTTAFRAMRCEGGWAEPLEFAVLVGSIAVWVAQAWDMVSRTLLVGVTGVGAQEIAAANLTEIWFALFAPFLVCGATFVGAAIVHVLLLLLGGAPRPYETTLRVVSYSWAVGVFNVVPICGVLIGAVWRIVVQIVGLREAHEIPTGRAAAAVLIPVLLACFCIVLAVIASLSVANLAQMGLQ